jgi:hypothetical protein
VYGLIDLGLTYYSSTLAQTKSLIRMDSGIAQSSRLGFRGNEDLGGGNAAFFTLETGFSADTGVLGQGGAIFGRQALVGIRNAAFRRAEHRPPVRLHEQSRHRLCDGSQFRRRFLRLGTACGRRQPAAS